MSWGWKTVSNQWPSACSVDNSDEMGWPGGGSAAGKNFSPWDRPFSDFHMVSCVGFELMTPEFTAKRLNTHLVNHSAFGGFWSDEQGWNGDLVYLCKQQNHRTHEQCTKAVIHPSTKVAHCCLTSVNRQLLITLYHNSWKSGDKKKQQKKKRSLEVWTLPQCLIFP